jgi:hypothetical protein
MSVEIPVRRISIEEATGDPEGKGYILEYIVVDSYTIHVLLLTDKDPTLVSTDYITIASDDFHRGGEVCEATGDVVVESLEEFDAFAARTFEESMGWSLEEIELHHEARKLVAALAAVLPAPIDR